MLVDSFGPKRIYTFLLMTSAILCFGFALARDFNELALMRFLLGFSGAGFVIGIRMISEWYPARQAGIAQGIYGGWGNFGSAGAAISLPTIAILFGGDDGWRYAVACTGALAFVYAFIFYFNTHDTPKGSTYFKPKKSGALEISSKVDFILYLIMNIPMYAALAVLTWKLSPTNIAMLDSSTTNIIYITLASIYVFQAFRMYQVNAHVFKTDVPEIERYKFSQVAILNLSYMVTFGSELAIISMLPLFFMDTFTLSPAGAGLVASIFAGLNLIMRPAGGWISDKYGRKRTLVVIMFFLIIGYGLMSQINETWSLTLAIIVTIFCSIFVNAGNGAVFAVVPLIKRRLTGQIAGMTGAYGNVGAVTFLTVLSFVSSEIFFIVIAGSAAIVFIATVFLLKEPSNKMTEILPDGTVQIIET